MSHTPTPWEAQFHTTATGKPFGIIVGGNNKNSAMDVVVCHGPDSQAEPVSFKAFQDGNANVLAAAPEMLEALQYLSNLHPRRCNLAEVTRARAAIASATGEAQ